MKNPFFSFILLISLAATAHASQNTDDELIIPGERVGFIKAATTEAELLHKLPKDQVQRVAYYTGQERYICATRIYPGTKQELTITWQSSPEFHSAPRSREAAEEIARQQCTAPPGEYKNPAYIVIKSPSTWKTSEGIYAGMTLGKAEKANGAPIVFSTCLCEREGYVINWNNPQLQKLSGIFIHDQMKRGLNHALYAKGYSQRSSKDFSARIKKQLFLNTLLVYFPKLS